jgi:hypothetical protein
VSVSGNFWRLAHAFFTEGVLQKRIFSVTRHNAGFTDVISLFAA